MKLNILHMVGIIVVSLLFAYFFKLVKIEGFGNTPPDYTSLITVHKQVEALNDAGTKLDAISVTDMNYTEKAKVKERIDTIKTQLQTWIDDRVIYVNKNSVIETPPLEKETLDKFKTIWMGKNDNGGSRTIAISMISKLNPADPNQQEIATQMRTIIKNLDAEIS